MSIRKSMLRTAWCLSLVLWSLTLTAVLLTQNKGICYAGPLFCFSATDGCLVLPIPQAGPRTWGDWGWWVQKPWGYGGYGFSSQIRCPTVSIPLALLFALFTTVLVGPF